MYCEEVRQTLHTKHFTSAVTISAVFLSTSISMFLRSQTRTAYLPLFTLSTPGSADFCVLLFALAVGHLDLQLHPQQLLSLWYYPAPWRKAPEQHQRGESEAVTLERTEPGVRDEPEAGSATGALKGQSSSRLTSTVACALGMLSRSMDSSSDNSTWLGSKRAPMRSTLLPIFLGLFTSLAILI